MKYLLFNLLLFSPFILNAQNDTMSNVNKLPYHEILEYPDNYSAGNVVARVVDGLGYRYYWATEGLRDEDYNYKPSDDSRTIGETMEHIYSLSRAVARVVQQQPLTKEDVDYSPKEFRMKTLNLLLDASNALRDKTSDELANMVVVFQREDRTSSFPFWNLLNGQLSDAIYHTGQITAFRRASGNPVDHRMNVFKGKNRK